MAIMTTMKRRNSYSSAAIAMMAIVVIFYGIVLAHYLPSFILSEQADGTAKVGIIGGAGSFSANTPSVPQQRVIGSGQSYRGLSTGAPSISFRSTSVRSEAMDVAVPMPMSSASHLGTAGGGASSVGNLSSQQVVRSYGGGIGRDASVSSGTSHDYSTTFLTAYTGTYHLADATLQQATLLSANATRAQQSRLTSPMRRRTGRVYDDDLGYYTDIDALPNDAIVGQKQTIGGVTYEYIGDGEWIIVEGEDLPDVDFPSPIGGLPVCFMLILVALFALKSRRASIKPVTERE